LTERAGFENPAYTADVQVEPSGPTKRVLSRGGDPE
jgi:hypothetical protein